MSFRSLLFLVGLSIAAGAAWYFLRPSEPQVVLPDGTGGAFPAARAGDVPKPVELSKAPRESLLEESETLPEMALRPGEVRIRLPTVGDDGIATGEQIRSALLEVPGLYLRWESAAAKEAFLAAKIRVPPNAYSPRDNALGAMLPVLVGAIREAGWKARFEAPRIVIGAAP